MSKNVLVISTSLRNGSNSEALADAFLAGAVFAGGVNGPGGIQGHPALEQAYAMGKQL